MEAILLDISKILDEVRNDIKVRGFVDDACPFADVENSGRKLEFHRHMFYERIYAMDASKTDMWYFDLEGNLLKVFLQKVVRKMNAFMLTKAFNNQNSFNAQSVAAMYEVAGYINQCEERIAELEKELKEMKMELKK